MATALRNPPPSKMRRESVVLLGDLLPLCDIAGVLLAAYLAALVYSPAAPGTPPPDHAWQAALAAALLAPLMLCDRAFVDYASGGRAMAFARCYILRFLMFSGAVLLIGQTSPALSSLPWGWLLWWFSGSLALTAVTRLFLVVNLRRLERRGVLTEAIAIVGSGLVADRLIHHLQQTRPGSVEIVGVFDDRAQHDPAVVNPPTASVDALLELGKTREIDWILLTCSPLAEEERHAMVHRLKSLSVPIGLCPQDLGLETPCDVVRYVGDGLPVTLLMDRQARAWTPLLRGLGTVLPPWIITLITLPLDLLQPLRVALGQLAARRTKTDGTMLPRERRHSALDAGKPLPGARPSAMRRRESRA